MRKQGFTLVEVLIGAALMAIVLSMFLSTLASLGIAEVKTRQRNQAVAVAQDTMELLYHASIENWSAFAAMEGTYGLTVRAAAVPTADFAYLDFRPALEQEITDRLSRTITLSPVFRTPDGEIADTGVLDPGLRKATTTVTWYEGSQQTSYQLSTYALEVRE